MKNKFKSTSFWLTLTACVVVLLTTVGAYCGFSVNEVSIISIASAVIGVLTCVGILKKENKKTSEEEFEKNERFNENCNEKDLQETCRNNINEIGDKTSNLNEQIEQNKTEIEQIKQQINNQILGEKK